MQLELLDMHTQGPLEGSEPVRNAVLTIGTPITHPLLNAYSLHLITKSYRFSFLRRLYQIPSCSSLLRLHNGKFKQ
jgi:hypothetical protein